MAGYLVDLDPLDFENITSNQMENRQICFLIFMVVLIIQDLISHIQAAFCPTAYQKEKKEDENFKSSSYDDVKDKTKKNHNLYGDNMWF